jgi:hypothetical protein
MIKKIRNKKGIAALCAFAAALFGVYGAALTIVSGPPLVGLGGIVLAGAICLTAAALIFGQRWATSYLKYHRQLLP